MNIDLIYATWPNHPDGLGWHKHSAALRDAGLTKQLTDAGFAVSEHIIEASGPGASELKAAFELGAQIGALVRASHHSGGLSVIICGSCAVAGLGAMAGLGGEHTAIVWMDAHPDINTPETTLTGLFEGMPVAMLLGEAWQAMAEDISDLTPATWSNLCYYGVRDLDPPEEETIEREGLPIVTDAEDIISELEGCDRAYVHLDMDVHDGAELRVNRYSSPGGPSAEKVRQDLVLVARDLPVAALSVTGIDPDIAGADAIACAIAHIMAFCTAWKTTNA